MTVTAIPDLDFGFSESEAILSTYGPATLAHQRKQAMEAFRSVGLPTQKWEDWKYLPLAELVAMNPGPSYGANVYRSEFAKFPGSKIAAHTLAFVNGQEAPELLVEANLPDGVLVMSLQEAWETHPEKLEPFLGKLAGNFEGYLGSELKAPFVSLNEAFLAEGAFIYIPKNVALEVPIQILHVSRVDAKPFGAHLRHLIVLEESAQAKVLESYLGLKGASFTNAVVEIVLAEGAILEHDKLQMETSEAIHFATTQVRQEASSTYTSNLISLGAKQSRSEVNAWVGGEHAETWLNGVYIGKDEQIHANQTRIDHQVPNCNSFEVYKGILNDRAQGVFNGKIFVYQDAQKTDAKQTNQALLLSPNAQINTKPQLEIFADDVKCTHGATVGQLRKDALFYLQARGIPKKQAEALLVYAFAAEVLEKITIPGLSELLEAELFAKLGMERFGG